MWWLIWSVLVVGTLVGAFFLLRGLWRTAMTFLRALSEAGEVFGAASARIAEAVELAQADAPDTSPVIFEDPVVLRQRVTDLRLRKAVRAAARHERRMTTARGWSLETWLTERTASRVPRS